MRLVFFLAAICVAVSAFGGSTPDGPIWTWTLAERVAVRQERRAQQLAGSSVQSSAASSGSGHFSIDGQTSPELFMPSELFNALLQGLSDDTQLSAVSREALAPGIRAFGFDEPVFWTTLDQATSSYRSQVRARNRTLWSLTRAELSQLSERPQTTADLKLCQARVAALESLREVFRTEGFDRFLYTVVAPTISIGTGGGYDNPDHLLSIERGCQ